MQTLFCVFFVHFALCWRFATLERYYAEKNDDAYLLYFMKQTVSLLSPSLLRHLQFQDFSCSSRPIMSLPWRALLYSHSLLFYLSLWHSTTEKDITAIPSQPSTTCQLWCQKHLILTPPITSKVGRRFQLNALNTPPLPPERQIHHMFQGKLFLWIQLEWWFLHRSSECICICQRLSSCSCFFTGRLYASWVQYYYYY